ncbi:MAG: iron-containing alcohol dehydrogenase [Planctomycetota bacterium]
MTQVPRKEFGLPHRTITGPGTLSEAGAEVLRLGRRAFIGCGRATMRKSGILDTLLSSLHAAGVEATVFDQIEGNPSTATVDKGVAAAQGFGADVMIGLGGGSAMDAVKMIARLARDKGRAVEYLMGGRTPDAPGLPVVAIPSTSGTGSEANHIAVITNEETGIKKGARIPESVPRLVILDPEVSAHMPPDLTAHTGLDALAHATESFVSTGATPLSRALSLKAIERIAIFLPRVVKNGGDMEARMEMALASYMAGASLMASVGLCHEMAMALGSFRKDHHGLLVARLMVPAMAVNRREADDDIRAIARAMGRNDANVDDALNCLAEFVRRFVPAGPLSDLGYKVTDIPEILRISKISTNITTNPKPLDDALRTRFLEGMIEEGDAR